MNLLLTSDFPLSGNEIILEHIRSKGTNPHIAWIPRFKKELLIIGASGGSMQFTKNVSLFRLLTETVDQVFTDHSEYKALNIVDYEFLPHLNKMESSFLQKVKEYSKRINHDIISIDDGSALFHTNGNIRYIGKTVRFRNGEIITDIET